MALRATLRRYHIWLGWLVGVPVLIWTVSGLMMTVKPIDEVRGTALITKPEPIGTVSGHVLPNIDGRPIQSMKLEQHGGRARWIVQFADGGMRQADAATGRMLPELNAADAAREASLRYRPDARVVSVTKVDPKRPPIDFRQPKSAWRVSMSDDTHIYVNSATGEVIAQRTGWWRVYDFFWGLHIMDLQGREETDNPWLVSFGALAAIMSMLALVLLFLSTRRKAPITSPAATPASPSPRR